MEELHTIGTFPAEQEGSSPVRAYKSKLYKGRFSKSPKCQPLLQTLDGWNVLFSYLVIVSL